MPIGVRRDAWQLSSDQAEVEVRIRRLLGKALKVYRELQNLT